MSLSRHVAAGNYTFVLMSGVQIALLPFSLTPTNYPVPIISPLAAKYQTYFLIPHAFIFALAVRLLTFQPTWIWSDAVRWALPEIIVGSVEMQRRGERDVEARLQAWEGTKYQVKGA